MTTQTGKNGNFDVRDNEIILLNSRVKMIRGEWHLEFSAGWERIKKLRDPLTDIEQQIAELAKRGQLGFIHHVSVSSVDAIILYLKGVITENRFSGAIITDLYTVFVGIPFNGIPFKVKVTPARIYFAQGPELIDDFGSPLRT